MDKTININIAGILFQIDDEAYRILRDYLQAINNRFRNVQGGHETIDDIESRIAEIFQSQKGLAGVISKENVEAMISIIGKPEDFDHNEYEAAQPVYSSQKRRMYRNPDDTIISGVCGGIGAYLDVDPVLFRILFVISTIFGVGLLVYIVLWIALPLANTDAKKREMFGDAFISARSQTRQADGTYANEYNTTSKIGNAVNEIFKAFGRVCFIFFRIIMIIVGITFVITGFVTILSLVMVLLFKFPGVFTNDGINVHMAFYTDFLSYIVSPSTAPWIIALALIAVILPMLAFIYWGVKMIFWFKAKDGIFSLAGLILWVLTLTALAILLFNEGISFAETGRSTSQKILSNVPDTLFIMTDHKSSDLKYDKELSLPDETFSVFMIDSTRQMFLPVRLDLNIADNGLAKVEINKRSQGRTRIDASRKAESLEYNYKISSDTLWLDEYFTLLPGSRWSGDEVRIKLYVPENTILYFDTTSENFFHNGIIIGKEENNTIFDSKYDSDTQSWELGNKYWIITEEGLTETQKAIPKQK